MPSNNVKNVANKIKFVKGIRFINIFNKNIIIEEKMKIA